MTAIVAANGLFGDKNYVVQVRPIFGAGNAGDWGPTFAIIKRAISVSPVMSELTQSPVGLRVSWSGTLDPAWDEQWLLKQFDTDPTEQNFDTFGTEIYRGSASNSVDVDLSQKSFISFAVVKIDKYGNRSTMSKRSKTFMAPTPPINASLINSSGGFSARFERATVSESNKYHILKIKNGEPFTSYAVTNKSKSGTQCTLTLSSGVPVVGENIQINISDAAFDGIYNVSSSTASSITYTHSSSGTVTAGPSSGYVIPTSGGPSTEGDEVFRVEIVNDLPTVISADFSPQTSGQKIYVALGTEDAYKNRSSWTLSDSQANALVYGRNYIADRDTISLRPDPGTGAETAVGNRYKDSYWKYGYYGFESVHNASTKELVVPGTAGGIKAEGVSTDTPDTILLGVQNGSSTALPFATAVANLQGRYYPSTINNTGQTSNVKLSKPLTDDPFYTKLHTEIVNDPPVTSWPLHPAGRGVVWAECSATSLLDDSIDTKDPIFLNGSQSVTGSFTLKPMSWGGTSDDAQAKLKLYAVTGEWSPSRGGIYDPHFFPTWDLDYSRTADIANNVVSRSSSTFTRTLTLASTDASQPAVGDTITVSIGNSSYDGVFIVTATGTNTISYLANASLTEGTTSVTSGTGFVLSNTPSASYVVTQKSRVNLSGLATLTVSGGTAPEAGSIIDVRIGDSIYDAVNATVTTSDGVSIFSYEITDTGSQANTAPTAGARVSVRPDPRDVNIELIQEITITRELDAGFFDGSGNGLAQTFYWNWSASSGKSISTVRFVWLLEFDQATISTYWLANKTFTIKLSDFQAWPGVNAYANLGDENIFNDTQTFLDGAIFQEDAHFEGDIHVVGDVIVDGNTLVANDISANNLSLLGDLDIEGIINASGNNILSTADILVYGRDYPRVSSDNAMGSTIATVNSIRPTANVPVSDTTHYLCIVSWSGAFESTVASDDWTFGLWRLSNDTVPTQQAPQTNWDKVRQVIGTGSNPSGSMVHFFNVRAADMPRIAWSVTAQRLNGTGTLQTTHTGNQAVYADSNRLELIAIPISKPGLGSGKPSSYLSQYSNLAPYATLATDTSDDPLITKSAVIRFSGGWKKSYKGDGSVNNYTGGDLNQGYYSSTNGNQKSAWGFGNDDWSADQGGDNIVGANVVAGSVKILSCTLTAKATHWWSYSGGTMIIGTHSSTKTASAPWGELAGKTTDRKRFSFPGTVSRNIDLGTTIGKELWNGHVRNNIWGGSGTPPAISNSNSARGILIGPGPTTSSQYYGSFDPRSLEVKIKVQWKEE